MPLNSTISNKKTIIDPHHGGLNEWGYYKNQLYFRNVGNERWVKCKRVSITPKRVKMLYELMKLKPPNLFKRFQQLVGIL